MFKKRTTGFISIVTLTVAQAAVADFTPLNIPSSYKISETGFQHAKPLQQRLTQRQGELFFDTTGLFIGASDVEYQDRVQSEDDPEIDAYAGIQKNVGLFGYHFGVKSYNASTNKDIEFQEYFVGANIKNLSFSYATNDEGEYTQVNLSQPVASFTVGLHVGETISLLGEKYKDWSLHASKEFKDITVNAIMTNNENPVIHGTEFNLGVKKNFKLF